MKATARVVAERRRGRSRCTTLRSSPPLTLRATGDGLHLVGTAAGPVGGDELALEVTVAAGASLTVRSVAAQLVMPAPTPTPTPKASTMHLEIEVGRGASLRWLPQPTVLVRGADHRLTTVVRLAPGADVVWRDEVVLGRDGEASGSLLHRFRVERADVPLLCTEAAFGPEWPSSAGPAGTNGARVVASTLLAGEPARRVLARLGGRAPETAGTLPAAAFPLGDDAVLLAALGPQLDATRAAVAGYGAPPAEPG